MRKLPFALIIFLTTISAFGQTTSVAPIQNISTDSNVVYRLFSTKNMYNFIRLDTRNGLMKQVQWGTEHKDRGSWWLNEEKFAKPAEEIIEALKELYNEDHENWEDTKEDWQKLQADSNVSDVDLKLPDIRRYILNYAEEYLNVFKPWPFEEEEYIKYWLDKRQIEKNGRFFLYPTTNFYNFILLDQIDGRAWQVQWSIEEKDRMVLRIY